MRLKRNRVVWLSHWLDNRGYGIFQEIQANGEDGEYILARAIIENNQFLAYEEIGQSKFEWKLKKIYENELKQNKEVIMDIMETLKGLTIKQLESLKPSYYNLAIDLKIKELKEKRALKEKNKVVKQVNVEDALLKPEVNATAKIKRNTKTTTSSAGRKRSVRKKSV